VPDHQTDHPTEPQTRAAKKKSSRAASSDSNQYKLAKKQTVPKQEQVFYDYVGRSFTDTDDHSHFQITRIVVPTKPPAKNKKRVLFFQFFDTNKFTAAPLDENDYEHTPCREMIRWNSKTKEFISAANYISWDSTHTVHSAATAERVSLGT
jgi:hypothetical protein